MRTNISSPTKYFSGALRIGQRRPFASSSTAPRSFRSAHPGHHDRRRGKQQRFPLAYSVHTAPAAPTQLRAISTRPSIPAVLVNDISNQELLIEVESGQAARYPSFWLRDHCQCSVCSHPHTHQRQHDTFALETSVKAENVSATEAGLEITWSDPSSHMSFFPWTWLQRHTPFPTPVNNVTTRHQQTRSWEPFLPSSPLPRTASDAVGSASGLQSILRQLDTHGISFIPNHPVSPEATESFLNHLGPIRNTHYGAFWDFTSQASPIDTAYTNLQLPLHTDNTYFTEPAGLQLFHLLSHTQSTASTNNPGDYDSSLGGHSTFSDGFAAAAHLHSLVPKYYEVLSTIPVVFEALGSDTGSYRNTHLSPLGNPILTHAPSHNTAPGSTKSLHPINLTCIRFNNLDRSPLTLFPSHSTMITWYAAAKLYSKILHSDEFMITVPLKPGEPVAFDNWRILHGRTAFEGRRRVCGGYIGVDDWRGKLMRYEEMKAGEGEG